MVHMRIRIEEMDYRPDTKSLLLLGVDAFHHIVTIEVNPVFPRQMAADLDFVARNPGSRLSIGGIDETSGAMAERNDEGRPAVDSVRPPPPETGP